MSKYSLFLNDVHRTLHLEQWETPVALLIIEKDEFHCKTKIKRVPCTVPEHAFAAVTSLKAACIFSVLIVTNYLSFLSKISAVEK